jgi:YD repeat-containing protein
MDGGYLTPRLRLSHVCWLLIWLCSASFGFAQTPLPCGQPLAGSIDAAGEEDRYTFDAVQGDMVWLHLVSTTDKFDPQMKLLAPDGQEIRGRFLRWVSLQKTGTYTALVSVSSGLNQTGHYEVSWQRLKNPCQGRELACGTVQTGYIDRPAQLDTYTFTVAAGGSVVVGLASTIDMWVRLYDPDGQGVAHFPPAGFIEKAGTYTLLVAKIGTFMPGNYHITLQRTKHPCNPMPIGSCLTEVMRTRGELATFTFAGAAGQKVMLRLESNSPDFYPEMKLYDPDGLQVGAFTHRSPPISETLKKAGAYTVLVHGGPEGRNLLRSNQLGSYTLSIGNVTATLLAPRGGEMFLTGSVVPITWKSSAFNPLLASHDILFSTDGGASYPVTIASALPANTQSFDWHIPADLVTTQGRMQIVARDFGGNACREASGADIAIVALPQAPGITYTYDELSRLIQVKYETGTTVTYTYDAAGNRLTQSVTRTPQ